MRKFLKKTNYASRYKKFGVHPKTLGWHSKRAAYQRYEEIVAELIFARKSVLDVGCGFGDIIPFIRKKTENFEYTGVDIVPEFIKEARKLYPKYRFLVRDYFRKPIEKKYDILIANGSLNSNVQRNLQFRKEAIKTMFGHAKEALFFNMVGKYPQPKTTKRNNIWVADPLEILKFCLTLNPMITFINHPGRREFSIILRKR